MREARAKLHKFPVSLDARPRFLTVPKKLLLFGARLCSVSHLKPFEQYELSKVKAGPAPTDVSAHLEVLLRSKSVGLEDVRWSCIAQPKWTEQPDRIAMTSAQSIPTLRPRSSGLADHWNFMKHPSSLITVRL